MKNVINTEYVDKQDDSNVLVIRVYKTSWDGLPEEAQ